MTPTITWARAGARRAARQFLRIRATEDTTVAEVAGAMLGVHAQVMSAAEISLGVRMDGVTRQNVRDALWTDGTLVKTFGPRGTLHLLPAAELPFWSAALPAIPPKGSFASGVRMSPEQSEQVVAAIGDALDGARLTADELGDEVVARTGAWAGDLVMPAFQGMWPRWRQVMHLAGQRGALCFAPDRGRKATYTRPPHHDPLPRDEAVAAYVRRYLYAYGPATAHDFARWAAAPQGWTGKLFASLAVAGAIEPVPFEPVPGGGTAWVAAGDTDFPEEEAAGAVGGVPGVRLLPYFDAYGIACHPRARLFPGRASVRALAGGQAGNFPLLLVDGEVAGVWHQRRRGRRATVTVEPLDRLTAAQERELAAEVARVGEVMEAVPELVVGEVTVGAHA
ncbi:winged helix DNA-binding domain-containing protein [Streptomyces sp. NPDC091292]|uniref:winged helix DNA-binding domain-containing protein n=1 Tax=Streptomyces sp. NPDC091292 TaxID=3365991 RepID=UPI00381724BE